MPITMRCPGCQTRFDFADDLDGKRIKCKSCGDIFRVADPDAARRAREEEDRRRKKDDDDRRTGRYSRPVDDDRRTGRYRKPDLDDEDNRPRSRRRDDDSADDYPRRRDDDEPPRKKKTNLLLILLPLGLLALVAVGVLGFFAIRGAKKKGSGPEAGDVVLAPSRSCPLEVAEKDVGTLVLPDSGTTFGLLRKTEAFKKSLVFEPYDIAAKRRVGKLDLSEVEDPKAWSLSPDGKQLLLMEARGIGWAGDQWLWVYGLDGKKVTADKWFPYTKDDKKPFDAPALHRAEFVANDRILTLATNRSYYIYSLPSFEAAAGAVAAVDKDGLGKHSHPPHESEYRYQWEAAFTADRKRMAVWTGDVYSIISTVDGVETNRTTSCRQLARDYWAKRNGDPDRVKAGPVAFSPDGSMLAGIIQPDFGQQRVLCIWSAAEQNLISRYEIPENQWNEAASIHWWGNRFIVTHGSRVDGMVVDVKTGLPRRQLMGPTYGKYGFSRDGKLWWAASEERTKPATVYVVDALDPDALTGGDDYEQILELSQEFFLRRLWLEPGGVLRQPTRDDPPIKQKLIRRP